MPESLRYARLWWALGAVMLAGILIVALWPLEEQPQALPHSDKFLHAIAFAFLFVWFGALADAGRHWQVFIGLLGYGLCMELLQSFTPYRLMSAGDLLADVFGLGVGWLLSGAGLSGWALWVEANLPVTFKK
jgi:VanZ family protein